MGKIIYLKMKKALIVTGYKCNNNCLFCSVNQNRDYNRVYSEIVNDMRESYANGCKAVEFIGGEVTIRNDIIKIVQKAKEMGFSVVSFESNGRMFANKEFTRKIIEAGLTNVLFSIHGHNANLHDKLTQSMGSFDQAIKGLREASEEGLMCNVNFVINKLNFKHVNKFLEFISGFKVNSVILSLVNPTANALINKKDIVPNIEEVGAALTKALKDRKVNVKIQNIPPCYLKENPDLVLSLKDKEDCIYIRDSDIKSNLKEEVLNLKAKRDFCELCRYDNECDGIWKGYLGDI